MRRNALPPYAREVVAALQRREPVNVFLYAGERAWQYAERRQHSVVVTDDWQTRDWRWIAGQKPTLVARDWTLETVEQFVHHLIERGAPLVVSLQVTHTDTGPKLDCTHYRAQRVAA